MYKKSETAKQLDLFASPYSRLSKRSTKILQKPSAWHNLFYKEIVSRIDESIFQVLYNQRKGRPNASIRVMIGMMILKEANGWSDRQLFEQARFNLLVRNALGLVNLDEDPPTEATYYDFRRAMAGYYDQTNEDLMDKVFKQITAEQLKAFDLNGNVIRMDSKLINSNIANAQRLDLVVETIRKFIRTAPEETMKAHLSEEDYALLSKLKKQTTENFVYGLTVSQKKEMLRKMGSIMRLLVLLYKESSPAHYEILKRVYEEQFVEVSVPTEKNNETNKNDARNEENSQKETENAPSKDQEQENLEAEKAEVQSVVNQEETKNNKISGKQKESTNKAVDTAEQESSASSKQMGQVEQEEINVVPKDANDIPSSSMQSPHDTEATFRRKGQGKSEQQVRGYHVNVTEARNYENTIGLITDIQTLPAHFSEDKFLFDALRNSLELFQEAYGEEAAIEKILVDGGYDSKYNRELFKGDDTPSLRISKNKGTPLMYHMKFNEEGELEVRLRSTGERIEAYFSEKAKKYVIKVPGKYRRYMTREEIEKYIAKEQLVGLNKEEAGLRANMESTIHQLFHLLGKNNKVKYRGLVRTHWYVLARALWVNLRRIVDGLFKLDFFHHFGALYRPISGLINRFLWYFTAYLLRKTPLQL